MEAAKPSPSTVVRLFCWLFHLVGQICLSILMVIQPRDNTCLVLKKIISRNTNETNWHSRSGWNFIQSAIFHRKFYVSSDFFFFWEKYGGYSSPLRFEPKTSQVDQWVPTELPSLGLKIWWLLPIDLYGFLARTRNLT